MNHKRLVRDALKKGKDIPQDVLEDI